MTAIFKENDAPPTPPAGYVSFYAKTDGLLYYKDDAGVELPIKPTGGGTGDLLSDGTVPLAANWDVGAFKITALQLESDVATGTPPLVVASMTAVTNLNADKLDGADLIDEDNMASDSDVHVPTQQSVKSYVDGKATDYATAAQGAKVDYLTVTQAVDLDAIETRVNQLDAAVVLQGSWDASVGTFPGGGTAQAGDSYIVSVGGTVDSVEFAANDRIVAIADNASTATYAANWLKLDYTDAVLSVDGNVGAVTSAQIAAAYASEVAAASQAEMETGTEAALRTMSPLRVAQAIAALAPSGAPEGTAVLSSGPVTDGHVLTADGAGGAAWESPAGGSGGATLVRKTADETVTSSTTLQNDDHLLLAVAANEVWEFEINLWFTTGTNFAGYLKYTITVPTGATIYFSETGFDGSAAHTDAFATSTSGSTRVSGTSNAGVIRHTRIKGLCVNGANAGNIQLQWAQNASDAGGTTVKANSTLKAWQLA